jgi:catechol 2,3-dioxygenase
MMSAATSPLRIGRVSLIVHDLGLVGDFYQQAVGLHLLSLDGETARLGVGDDVLLELRQDKATRRRSPREAGLFHTAFLLPSRGDLGRWAKNAAATGAAVVGASDHLVSEAIYLTDPEGNGVEIYADRSEQQWRWDGGLVQMATHALDVEALIASGGADPWQGFPGGSTVGHVHLQVGALAPAEEFYAGVLGQEVTCRYPGGTFYSWGGYHHHIATNVWNSRGAPVRTPSTGLGDVEILATSEALAAIGRRTARPAGESLTLFDPWGTSITVAC